MVELRQDKGVFKIFAWDKFDLFLILPKLDFRTSHLTYIIYMNPEIQFVING